MRADVILFCAYIFFTEVKNNFSLLQLIFVSDAILIRPVNSSEGLRIFCSCGALEI